MTDQSPHPHRRPAARLTMPAAIAALSLSILTGCISADEAPPVATLNERLRALDMTGIVTPSRDPNGGAVVYDTTVIGTEDAVAWTRDWCAVFDRTASNQTVTGQGGLLGANNERMRFDCT